MIDFYQTLKVAESADNEQIRHSFRILAKNYHPELNKNPDSREMFCRIYQAYSILSNSSNRSIYDLELKAWKKK